MLYRYTLDTPTEDFCPITAQVQGAVAESGVQDGICLVYCPHTTAGITINENADPDVVTDLLLAYRKSAGVPPCRGKFLGARPCFRCGKQRHDSGEKRQTGAGYMAGCLFLRVRRAAAENLSGHRDGSA